LAGKERFHGDSINLEQALDDIHERFGDDAIGRGSELEKPDR